MLVDLAKVAIIHKFGLANYLLDSPMVTCSAGSILDVSKYRDTCERSISILGGIAILRYIEY